MNSWKQEDSVIFHTVYLATMESSEVTHVVTDGLVKPCFLSMKLYRGLSSVVSGLYLPWLSSVVSGLYLPGLSSVVSGLYLPGLSSVVSGLYLPGPPTVLVLMACSAQSRKTCCSSIA